MTTSPSATNRSAAAPEPAIAPAGVGWALVGLVAGGVVMGLTALAARSSIGGPDWSLGGNGALAVFAGGIAATLGGGWAAIATRAAPRRPLAATVAGLASLLIVTAWLFAFLLPAPLRALGESGVGPLLLAIAAGLLLPRLTQTPGGAPFSLPTLVASLLLAVVILVGAGPFRGYLGWLVVPLLVDLPLLAGAGGTRAGARPRLLAACLALTVGVGLAVVAGLLLGTGG